MAESSVNLSTVNQHPYREILRLAGPLVLSMTGFMFMQLIDGMFLAWYSSEAIAAAGTAGMASYMMLSPFIATAGYGASFVSQYLGAGRPERAGAAIWQSIYFSMAGGVLIFAAAYVLSPLFRHMGHNASLAELEVVYFKISCMGGITSLLASSLSAFFSARGDVRTLMGVQLAGLAINAVLDYALIFGHWHMPRMGIVGAAIATMTAQGIVAAWLGALFVGTPAFRKTFASWSGRAVEIKLFLRLIRFGLPSGIRHLAEMLGASVFLFYVGRIGTLELTASTIGWRINGFAFFPLIGLGQAVGTLVGHAQGAGNPQLSTRITLRGALIAEIWMLACAAAFLLLPGQLYSLFQSAQADPGQQAMLRETTTVLLRFVALYCLVDACNIVFAAALQYAGDTQWTFWAIVILNGLLVAAMAITDAFHGGLYAQWIMLTALTVLMAFTWAGRFASGAWKSIALVEPHTKIEQEI